MDAPRTASVFLRLWDIAARILALRTFFGIQFFQDCFQVVTSRKRKLDSDSERSGEPGRTRTSNPLLNPETLSSWLFLHFHASCITVFEGVWQGFVPKVVPRFLKSPSVGS